MLCDVNKQSARNMVQDRGYYNIILLHNRSLHHLSRRYDMAIISCTFIRGNCLLSMLVSLCFRHHMLILISSQSIYQSLMCPSIAGHSKRCIVAAVSHRRHHGILIADDAVVPSRIQEEIGRHRWTAANSRTVVTLMAAGNGRG